MCILSLSYLFPPDISAAFLLQVLAGLPDDQRAAVLAARAEGALDLQGQPDELDEVRPLIDLAAARFTCCSTWNWCTSVLQVLL